MEHCCKLCNYVTSRFHDYERHIMSQAHNKNLTNCPICPVHLTNQSSLIRHIKRKHSHDLSKTELDAIRKQIAELRAIIIESHKQQLKVKDKQLDVKDEQIKMLNKTVIYLIKFLNKNRANPEPIEWKPSHSAKYINYDFIFKLLQFYNSSNTASPYSGNIDLEAITVHIGNLIVQVFKKESICEWLLYCSDVARSNYATTKSNDNKGIWFHDKAGAHIIDFVVTPAVDAILSKINQFAPDIAKSLNLSTDNLLFFSARVRQFFDKKYILINKIIHHISSKFSVAPDLVIDEITKYIDQLPVNPPIEPVEIKPPKRNRNYDFKFDGMDDFTIIKKSSRTTHIKSEQCSDFI